MNPIEEIERLWKLYQEGALSDKEYAAEKAKLLDINSVENVKQDKLSKLNELKYKACDLRLEKSELNNKLTQLRLSKEQVEREFKAIEESYREVHVSKGGSVDSYLPSKSGSVLSAIFFSIVSVLALFIAGEYGPIASAVIFLVGILNSVCMWHKASCLENDTNWYLSRSSNCSSQISEVSLKISQVEKEIEVIENQILQAQEEINQP